MGKIVSIIERFDDLHHLEGASLEEIGFAEQELGLTFSEEYREYLLKYGVASFGSHEFTGIISSPRLNVVLASKREREYNPEIPSGMYLIELLGIEDYSIWQDEEGKVYRCSLEHQPMKVADSLAEYITSLA